MREFLLVTIAGIVSGITSPFISGFIVAVVEKLNSF
jgi:hypothetical protein